LFIILAHFEQGIQFTPQNKSSALGSDTGSQTRAELPQQQDPVSETDQFVSPLQPQAQGLLGLPYEGQEPAFEDGFETIRAERRARWEEAGEVPSIAAGVPGTPTESGKLNYDKDQFWWWRDLSQDGRKLYEILIGEGGDWDILPEYADQVGFNLNTALVELRERGFLDESDPHRVRLAGKNL